MDTHLNQKQFDEGVNHPVQSWAWGSFREENGAEVERFMVDGKNFTVTFHKLPIFGQTLGVLTQCHQVDKKVLEVVHEIALKHKALFVKIEPYCYSDVLDKKSLEQMRQKMTELGLKKGRSLYPEHSFVIDLREPQDVLLSRMKSKTRYNVRLAQKKGVRARITRDDADFENYLRLLEETTQRQVFFAHTLSYQRRMWGKMKKAGIAHLAVAEFENQTLAAFVLFEFGGRLYYPYGASTRDHRELMAPQLLMWESIQFGKRIGCMEFEMWGSLGDEPDTNHSWYGFHRFKAGFGGKHIAYIGAYDLVLSPMFYRIYQFLDSVRWWWLKKGNTK